MDSYVPGLNFSRTITEVIEIKLINYIWKLGFKKPGQVSVAVKHLKSATKYLLRNLAHIDIFSHLFPTLSTLTKASKLFIDPLRSLNNVVPLSGGKQPVDKRGSLAVENNTSHLIVEMSSEN